MKSDQELVSWSSGSCQPTLHSCLMRHCVVVDDTDQLVGVVTLSDIVEHLSYESFVEMKIIAQVMTRIVCTVGQIPGCAGAARMAMSCIVLTEGAKTGRHYFFLYLTFLSLIKYKKINATVEVFYYCAHPRQNNQPPAEIDILPSPLADRAGHRRLVRVFGNRR